MLTHKVAKCILPGDTTLVALTTFGGAYSTNVKLRSVERRRGNSREQDRETKKKEKNDTESRVNRGGGLLEDG